MFVWKYILLLLSGASWRSASGVGAEWNYPVVKLVLFLFPPKLISFPDHHSSMVVATSQTQVCPWLWARASGMLFPRLLQSSEGPHPGPCLSPLYLLSFTAHYFFHGIYHNRQVPCFLICSWSVSSIRCRSPKSKYSVLLISHILCAPNQWGGKRVPSCWVFVQKMPLKGEGGNKALWARDVFPAATGV